MVARSMLRVAYGAMEPLVQRRMAKDIDDLVRDLLIRGLMLWQSEGWERFDDLEANCTVQLFRRLDDLSRSTLGLRSLTVEYEVHELTLDILEARQSAATAKRADLVVRMGSASRRTIECKRLRLGGGYPKAYVEEGMLRFVHAAYAAEDPYGFMVGYIQADSSGEIMDKANLVVDAHPELGASHQLMLVVGGAVCRLGSKHARPSSSEIELEHLWADLST